MPSLLGAVGVLWRGALGAGVAAACLGLVASTALAEALPAFSGEIAYTRYKGAGENVKKVPYRYENGVLSLGTPVPLAATHGANGITRTPDGGLVVGGQGNRIHLVIPDGSGAHVTVGASGAQAHHVTLAPGGTHAWAGGAPGAPTEVPLAPFGEGRLRPVTGDDDLITEIAFDAAGRAYYTTGDYDGWGHFGRIDLARMTTQRLIADIEAAHGITFDPFTGDLFLFGGDEIVQIDPDRPRHVKSRVRVTRDSQFDIGRTDGHGHLFATRNDGYLVFVDYTGAGLIGDPANAVRVVYLDSHLDGVALLSAPELAEEAAAGPARTAAADDPAGGSGGGAGSGGNGSGSNGSGGSGSGGNGSGGNGSGGSGSGGSGAGGAGSGGPEGAGTDGAGGAGNETPDARLARVGGAPGQIALAGAPTPATPATHAPPDAVDEAASSPAAPALAPGLLSVAAVVAAAAGLARALRRRAGRPLPAGALVIIGAALAVGAAYAAHANFAGADVAPGLATAALLLAAALALVHASGALPAMAAGALGGAQPGSGATDSLAAAGPAVSSALAAASASVVPLEPAPFSPGSGGGSVVMGEGPTEAGRLGAPAQAAEPAPPDASGSATIAMGEGAMDDAHDAEIAAGFSGWWGLPPLLWMARGGWKARTPPIHREAGTSEDFREPHESSILREGLRGADEAAPPKTYLSMTVEEVVAQLKVREPAAPDVIEIAPALVVAAPLETLRPVVRALLTHAWRRTATRAEGHIAFGVAPDGKSFVVRDNGSAPLAGGWPVTDEVGGGAERLDAARRLVERVGGKLWAEAAPGGGAAVHFSLGETA